MPASIPIQRKTPFVIDTRPLNEVASPRAGLLSVSRALRSLKLPGLVEANVNLKQRARGCTEGQFIESLILLNAAGGDCYEDLVLLEEDACLRRGLGYTPAKAGATRKFIEKFHDPALEQKRPPREVQKSFIPDQSLSLAGLQEVQAGLVGQIARKHEEAGRAQKIATVDQDATIIASHKRNALAHYDGGRGYQPMVAVWAELDVVLADEFRDGNVPAKQAPLTCARMAFEALPATIQQRYFRGDSACHESDLIGWLSSPQRERESGGCIGFAVSAVMSKELKQTLEAIPHRQWQTFDKESDGTLRQWVEVDFVPGNKSEKKDALPLRYVGLRLLKAQGTLFADGSDRHHHAILTNRTEAGDQLLQWHREKAGTVEHTHEEVKNGLGGGRLPSNKFGANAAWFRIALLTYNVISALRGLALDGELRTAKLKKLRLQVFHLGGRMSRSQCKLRLRFCASKEAIARLLNIWRVFHLPTQATAFR